MCISNPQLAQISLLITVEWRVRFDISNPAVASHTHHGVSSDLSWERAIRRASDALPGVVDIVQKVANVGVAGVQGYKAISAAAML